MRVELEKRLRLGRVALPEEPPLGPVGGVLGDDVVDEVAVRDGEDIVELLEGQTLAGKAGRDGTDEMNWGPSNEVSGQASKVGVARFAHLGFWHEQVDHPKGH